MFFVLGALSSPARRAMVVLLDYQLSFSPSTQFPGVSLFNWPLRHILALFIINLNKEA